MRQNSRPRLFMSNPGFLVQKVSLGEPQSCSRSLWHKLNPHHRLSSPGSRLPGKPGHFNELIRLQPEETAIVWVAILLMMDLPKEDGVDFALHQERSRRGKPAVELL